LLINTTWFGPQFDNGEWQRVQQLIDQNQQYHNLFMLAVIDPQYLRQQELEYIQQSLGIQRTRYIGMYENSEHEWNFHAVAVQKHCPQYLESDLLPTELDRAFLLYQRKPRPHRIAITQQLIDRGVLDCGIVTLGSNEDHNYDWTQQTDIPRVLTIEDDPADYKHNGATTDFSGIPNDLVSLGRLDIWRRCFLNVVSETEFERDQPRFVTEKMWKPIIGLRPFVIHGQTKTYQWLRQQGFRTFNHHWSHIDVEHNSDVHQTTVDVLQWVCALTPQQRLDLYHAMLPDLKHNAARYQEFAQEQWVKMHNLFVDPSSQSML